MEPRMVVFDVDGTLRPNLDPVSPEVSARLRAIQENGIELSLISGKDMAYVHGVADGMGISASFAVGEVGGVILEVSTHRQIVYSVSNDLRRALGRCERQLRKQFRSRLWFQPNLVNITVLPIVGLQVKEVFEYAQSIAPPESGLYVSTHSGMIDMMPQGLNKGIFLAHLESLGYPNLSLIAVGDGENDIPMLKRAGLSVTFEDALLEVRESAGLVVADIDEALSVVEGVVRGNL
ncbi:MAG: Cof-type HAD-IIB family hydrolase [Actinobacteria bacterium]|nr:Cof-type HAD-IIB family hydrolase [Actinomycetota bacterium]